uniref:Proteasome assembly chaperone 1 n=1 Tax=Noccaea caerulescens TaxID=107243 RepID=A0A1J3FHK8_NOCCA
MEDVLTENPPPSRFFQEDLNNFVPPPKPLPSPFIVFSNPKPELPLRPSLLIVAVSSPSLYVFHSLPSKTLIGSLILPEVPFSGNTVEPSLEDKSCNIYSYDGDKNSILLVSVQLPASPERSNLVSRLLIGQDIIPERVVILDSIQSRNFRGRLSPDETLAAKLETSSEKKAAATSRVNLDYFPSGSVVDGLSASLLSRCQIKNIRGTLVVSWPEFGPSVVRFVGALLKNIVPGLDIASVNKDLEKYSSRTGLKKDAWLDSDLYT